MSQSEVESDDPWDGEAHEHVPHHPEAPDIVAEEPAGTIGGHSNVSCGDGRDTAQRRDAPDQIVIPDEVLLLLSAVMERENYQTREGKSEVIRQEEGHTNDEEEIKNNRKTPSHACHR
jgi:hypothetical protein